MPILKKLIVQVFRPTKTWQAHSTPIVWLGVLDDRPGYLISHGRGESVIIWNAEGTIVHKMQVHHDGFCKSDLLANKIAIPSGKNSIEMLTINQMTSLEPSRTLTIDSDEGALMAVKLLSKDTRVVAAYESGCICIWDGDVVVHRTRVESMPTCLGHHAQHNEILLGTSSETLHILDADKLTQLKAIELTNPGLNFTALRLSDSRVYATAGWDKRIRFFSARTHKKLCVLQVHEDSLNALVFVAGHCGATSLLAAGSSDSLISLWDLYGGDAGGSHQNP